MRGEERSGEGKREKKGGTDGGRMEREVENHTFFT